MTIRFTTILAAALAWAAAGFVALPAFAQSADPLSEQSILRDPDTPALGNAKGDITIVEYFDYQCPYCKKVSPELAKVAQEDGHVRLVYKDWPIFGDPSVYAARLVQAAKYQDKYAEAHDALMALPGKLSDDKVDAALAAAGIDLDRARKDLGGHQDAIDALLARNHQQAMAFGFQGTPAFIIGHFRVPGALDAAGFKQAITEARAAAKKGAKK